MNKIILPIEYFIANIQVNEYDNDGEDITDFPDTKED